MTAGAGNLADWADVALAVKPPIVRLVASGVQLVAHNTVTPMQFGVGSEVFDDNVWHDEVTNNTRITPSIPGVYEVGGSIALGGRTDYVTAYGWLRQNGSGATGGTAFAPAGKLTLPATQINSTVMIHVPVSKIAFNGTDWIEMCTQITNGAAAGQNTAVSFQFTTVFELKFLYKV